MGTNARADFNIATGLKWVPVKYTSAVGASGDGAVAQQVGLSPEAGGLNSWQNTSLDPYIAFFFHEQVGALIGLDMGYASFHDEYPINNNGLAQGQDARCAGTGGIHPCDQSFFQFGFTIGGKFYLNRPAAQRVSPYLYVDFYKYFASISTSDAVNPDRAGALAGLHSPLGFNIAFGAEYFFTTSFSLGAEVLGLRYSYVEGDWQQPVNPMDMNSATNREIEKFQYLTLYTGITINYRFLATASVRTYEDQEDQANPRPRRQPVRRRPAPQPDYNNGGDDSPPPPPSPESVD